MNEVTEERTPKRQFEVLVVRKGLDEVYEYVIDIREMSTDIVLTGVRILWDNKFYECRIDVARVNRRV